MDRDIRTYFLFIGLPAVLITAAGLAALLFGVSGIATEVKVLDVEKQHDRYEQRIKNRMASRLKTYRETSVADYAYWVNEMGGFGTHNKSEHWVNRSMYEVALEFANKLGAEIINKLPL